MSLEQFETVSKLLPDALGSVFSLLWIKDSWKRLIGMFFAGTAFAYYATNYCVKVSGLDAGLVGFLLGLFGMSIVASVVVGWQSLDIGAIFTEVIRRVLRLPAKKEG